MATQTNTPSGWVGWAYFASFMLILVGVLQVIAGLVALFNNEFFVVTQRSILAFDFTTWGWIHLVLGIVIFMAGLELLRGAAWARIIAVILALLSFVANMSFFNAYPFWSAIIMLVDVLVIYALTVRGGELKDRV